MKRLLAAILILAVSPAVAQQETYSGFHVVRNQTPLNVDSSGESSSLTSPSPSVVVSNTGSKTVYCQPGTATTSSQMISAGGWFQFELSGAATLSCITSGADTSIVNVVQGYGQANGGGGGGSGGTGGAVTATITGPLASTSTDAQSVAITASTQSVFGSLTSTAYADTTGAASGSVNGILKGLFVSQNSPIPAQSTHTVNIGAVDSISPYPATAVPITASATGTTGATTATLTAVSGHTTYICGFSIRANATAAVTNNATVTGTVTGTLNFTQWTAPLASGLGVTEEAFVPCVPASAVTTNIAVVSGAPGTGGVVSVTAWGYSI